MSKTSQTIVYERHGNPADVLQIKTEPWPTPAADEAVVEMRAAPINPADINAIEGKYPGRREVPAIPGMVPAPGARGDGCAFVDRCQAPVARCGTDLPRLTAMGVGRDAACWNPAS